MFVGNKTLIILDADVAPAITPVDDIGVAYVKNTQIFYFYIGGGSWTKLNLGALSGATKDGNEELITRADTDENAAPTALEVPSPVNGDTAKIHLTNGKVVYWVYNGGWSKAWVMESGGATNLSNGARTAGDYTISNDNGSDVVLQAATTLLAGLLAAADKQKLDFLTVSSTVNVNTLKNRQDDLITLSGVLAGSTNNGSFSGSTIPDNSTTKAALQALETALEAINVYVKSVANTNSIALSVNGSGELTANVKRSASQDNNYNITESADGIKLTRQALTAYDTHAAAHAAVNVGESYILTKTNLEGVVSDGVSGPIFWRKV